LESVSIEVDLDLEFLGVLGVVEVGVELLGDALREADEELVLGLENA